MTLMRRWIERTWRRAALLVGLSACALGALAAGPLQKTSPPGYYRMMLGEFEITALNDGTVDLNVGQLLTNTTVARVRAALARAYLTDPVETSVNAYLVNTGARLVLIDAGAGTLFGPTLGKLVANLKAAGYAPEQVDEIYITHMHPDHVGGLAADGATVFPNAIVRADQREADYWLSEKNLAAAPDEGKGFFKGAMASLNPYVAAGRFKPFNLDSKGGGTELVPGVRAIATPGHTPGHTIYAIESGGQRFVTWGDLMHVAAVQFPAPTTTIQFDVDSRAAMSQRRQQFADAARRGYYVAGAHLPFPGIGRLRSGGDGYDWIPANFSVLR